ncbi:MAG: hypothetical protein SVR08_02000 [Spirochaetota bacterium]|nr:hypothetical protein [Spirochaetota bacterium]
MIDYIKSLNWIDYFYYCLVEPRKLIKLITSEERKPFIPGVLIILSVSFIEILTISLLGKENSFFYYKISYGLILTFIVIQIQIVIFAGLIDLLFQLRGYNGNIKNLINLFNFSLFPRTLLLPLVFIFEVLNFAPIFFYILFSMFLFIWQALIVIQGISEMNRRSFAESVIFYLFPFFFIGVIIIFSSTLIIINIVGFITSV